MTYVLSKNVIKHLIKEESDTRKRYKALGKKYNIPELVKAGSQEGSHAKLFKKLQKEKRKW